jgi:hypothetical protein
MKLGIEGMHLNIIKAVCDKSIANIILNGEKTETISAKVRNETRVSTLSTLIIKWIKDLNTRPETLKLLHERARNT